MGGLLIVAIDGLPADMVLFGQRDLSMLGFLPIWGFKTGAGLLGSGDLMGLDMTG